MEQSDRTAHHRCCSHRDSDRKPDLSRLTDCVFGPLLPLEKLFSCPRQCHFRKEEPHGFKTLCRRVALCGD
jgi:hypothetical protein